MPHLNSLTIHARHRKPSSLISHYLRPPWASRLWLGAFPAYEPLCTRNNAHYRTHPSNHAAVELNSITNASTRTFTTPEGPNPVGGTSFRRPERSEGTAKVDKRDRLRPGKPPKRKRSCGDSPVPSLSRDSWQATLIPLAHLPEIYPMICRRCPSLPSSLLRSPRTCAGISGCSR